MEQINYGATVHVIRAEIGNVSWNLDLSRRSRQLDWNLKFIFISGENPNFNLIYLRQQQTTMRTNIILKIFLGYLWAREGEREKDRGRAR